MTSASCGGSVADATVKARRYRPSASLEPSGTFAHHGEVVEGGGDLGVLGAEPRGLQLEQRAEVALRSDRVAFRRCLFGSDEHRLLFERVRHLPSGPQELGGSRSTT